MNITIYSLKSLRIYQKKRRKQSFYAKKYIFIWTTITYILIMWQYNERQEDVYYAISFPLSLSWQFLLYVCMHNFNLLNASTLPHWKMRPIFHFDHDVLLSWFSFSISFFLFHKSLFTMHTNDTWRCGRMQ
jgi:hypothetical protein